MSAVAEPKHFSPGEGTTFKVGRITMTFKTTAGDSWNAYTVCEAVKPPESGAGPEVGHQIIISSPGGIFDAMIAEVTALDTGSPIRAASDDAKAIAMKFGLEFLTS